CRSGLCLAGDGRDCSDLDESCRIGLCAEASASCEAVPKPDDTGCHDNSVCTIADLCRDGECVGVALPDQTVCDDGNPNTPRSVCLDGECLASRLYGVNPGITYNCPAGIAFAIALLEFVDDGQTLTVLGAPVLMTGPGNIASGGSFAVSGSMGEGGCVQTYRLTGTFNATGWQGQFRAEYSMGCACTWGIFNVQGTLK
ncbi:MAG: hypothetical protein RBU21_24635, partial [FCB group bacterium]|nr:hypothetical protein [FCB group bacterium]